MTTLNLRYNDSLTQENKVMIDFNHKDKLVNPRFDFGYKIQVQTYRQIR